MVPSLSKQQRAFAASLRRPDGPVPEDVTHPGSVPPIKRFNVYRNNVATAEIDALAATYPAVEALVGSEFFRATAREFAVQFPPRSPLLFRFGGDFAYFLSDFPPASQVPYLADIARLEWAQLQAYHAADATSVPIEKLGDIPPEDVGDVRFTFHPSTHLVRSKYPIVSIWADCTGRSELSPPDISASEDALVVRPAIEVNTRALSGGAGEFLAGLMRGQTLQSAADVAADQVSEFDLSLHLSGLFETGCVMAIERPTPGGNR